MSVTGHSELDVVTFDDGPGSTGALGDKVFRGMAAGAGVFFILLIAGVAAFLIGQAVPALMKDQANFLTDRVWNLGNLSAPMFRIPGPLWVTGISSPIALPPAAPGAVGVALSLTHGP